VRPPRYGVSPCCSPLWRRYCHDRSPCDAGPWRRFYDDPERAWAGIDPSDGRSTGPRPAGGLGRGLRPVGPLAADGRPDGPEGYPGRLRGHFRGHFRGHGAGAGGGPVRARAGSGPDRRVHPPGDAQGGPGTPSHPGLGLELAGHPAARHPSTGQAGLGVEAGGPGQARFQDIPGPDGSHGRPGREKSARESTDRRAAGDTPLPHHPSPGQPAGYRGDEP
jgi:hypothetical protein